MDIATLIEEIKKYMPITPAFIRGAEVKVDDILGAFFVIKYLSIRLDSPTVKSFSDQILNNFVRIFNRTNWENIDYIKKIAKDVRPSELDLAIVYLINTLANIDTFNIPKILELYADIFCKISESVKKQY